MIYPVNAKARGGAKLDKVAQVPVIVDASAHIGTPDARKKLET